MSAALDRYDLLNRLVDALASDPRIGGVWLEGSMARGDADEFSDVDLHAYVPFDDDGDAGMAPILENLPGLLAPVGRIVYLRTLPGTTLTTAVMEDGSRFDVMLETEEDLKRPRHSVKVLHDPGGELWTRLRFSDTREGIDGSRVEATIREFWRCLGLLPVVAGRGELIVSFQGYALMAGMAADVLLASRGTVRGSGVKRLNPYLDPHDRMALEAALPQGPNLRDLAEAQLRLAGLVSRQGRRAAVTLGFHYPEALERAVHEYVAREVKRFGWADHFPELRMGAEDEIELRNEK